MNFRSKLKRLSESSSLLQNITLVSGLLLCLLPMTGCKEKDPSAKPVQVLERPPFKTITDSIRKYPGVPGMYMERAIRLSQNNKLDLATADFKKAWELSGDENIALEYVSNLLLVNNINEAMKVLQDGVVKFPENAEFNRRLGEIYAESGNMEGALKEFNTIINKDPENFEAWYDKGSLLTKLRDTTGAIEAYEKSFALQPINHTGIALANLFIGRKDPKALKIVNYLIARDTANLQTDAIFTKGVYYTETGKKDLALQQFEECIRRDWKLTDAYIEKGIIFYEQKKIDTALATFNMSVTVSNTNADGYFWMGRCYEMKSDRTKAIENYQRALSLDNTFIEAAERIKSLKNS
ncbi:MAG: tetratricopeptide repeat protein [Flavitalea sp.]